jgi:hypothetical protein
LDASPNDFSPEGDVALKGKELTKPIVRLPGISPLAFCDSPVGAMKAILSELIP